MPNLNFTITEEQSFDLELVKRCIKDAKREDLEDTVISLLEQNYIFKNQIKNLLIG